MESVETFCAELQLQSFPHSRRFLYTFGPRRIALPVLPSWCVMLFPHPIQFGPVLRADLPVSAIMDECELLLLFTHQDSRSRRLPPLTELRDGMVAVEPINADIRNVADDHSSIPRTLLRFGGANIGTRDTSPCEIPAQLRRVESLDLADVRALFRIRPFM